MDEFVSNTMTEMIDSYVPQSQEVIEHVVVKPKLKIKKVKKKRPKGTEEEEFLMRKTDIAIRKLEAAHAARTHTKLKLSHIDALVERAKKVRNQEAHQDKV